MSKLFKNALTEKYGLYYLLLLNLVKHCVNWQLAIFENLTKKRLDLTLIILG